MNQNYKPKKKLYKRWWFWLIVVVIIGFLGSLGGNKDSDGEKVASNGTKQEETKKKNEPTIYQVGDTIQLKNYKVTVNGLRTGMGNDFWKPKDGNEFLYIDCTVENTSDKEQAVSSIMMFKVVDGDGRSLSQSLAPDANGQLDGSVGVGRKIAGEYVVEVPQGKTGLELEFDGSLLTTEKMIVKLR